MKNLVIVESPHKVKIIEKFLGSDFTVMSSNGHIRDLAKREMSIDIENGYTPLYQISDDKKKLVSSLEKAAKSADQVWLASDEDREGEAIAWHLLETLKLDADTTQRIVFNEITKNAILYAIDHPRKIDMNLVDAQQARRVLDRLVGYEISPILWSKIKPALSAGRVQSVAVRLIVEREEEIHKFVSQSYFKLTSTFHTAAGTALRAELSKHIATEEEATDILTVMGHSGFTVDRIDTKPAHRSPAPPFTTSTLQQEASRKLGYSVARTMQIAQQLYEEGFITYMRTDSVNLSEFALSACETEIGNLFGKDYVKTRRYRTKTKGAQEAHEAIRPTDMSYHTIAADPSGRHLYELIWKRAIASQMADAQIEKTTIDICCDNTDTHGKPLTFSAVGERVLFDGFLKVYLESTDDDDQDQDKESLLPKLAEGEHLALADAVAAQHFTQHPPRYTEASLVKKLEDLGIGRPSTYAPTISTILKREYVVKEDRDPMPLDTVQLMLRNGEVSRNVKHEKVGVEKSKLFPTDIGTVVNQFLLAHFNDILDYNFTATVEKDFDEIAEGNKTWHDVIDQFYVPFHKIIRTTQQNSHKTSGERLVGTDPATGKNVYAKIGRYGTLIQIGDTNNDEKPRFASMKKGQSIESITLDEALALFSLPRTVGESEGKEIIVSIGKFGPYIRHDGKFYSLPKADDPYEVTLERCLEIIAAKQLAEAEKERLKALFPHEIGIADGEPVVSNIGRYGPYLTYKGENYRLPKDSAPLEITLDDALAIIQSNSGKKSKTKKK